MVVLVLNFIVIRNEIQLQIFSRIWVFQVIKIDILLLKSRSHFISYAQWLLCWMTIVIAYYLYLWSIMSNDVFNMVASRYNVFNNEKIGWQNFTMLLILHRSVPLYTYPCTYALFIKTIFVYYITLTLHFFRAWALH